MALTESAAREITDALVIFSMSMITYFGISNWGGLELMHNVFGIEQQKPSIMYFLALRW